MLLSAGLAGSDLNQLQNCAVGILETGKQRTPPARLQDLRLGVKLDALGLELFVGFLKVSGVQRDADDTGVIEARIGAAFGARAKPFNQVQIDRTGIVAQL